MLKEKNDCAVNGWTVNDRGVEVFGEMPKDGVVYRYMDVERYFDLVEKKILALSHITMWEDPYEGFIFRAAIDALPDDQQRILVYDSFKYYYGQSWTVKNEESDETWRAHGKRGSVVRIRTSIGKLIELLTERATGDEVCCLAPSTADVKMGCVRYAKTKDEFKKLLHFQSVCDVLDGDEQARLQMFFIKRPQFSSEEEFRIMVHARDGELDRASDTDGRFLKICIDPNNLIEEVLIDPCMARHQYEQLICRTRHFCPTITPRKSDLFDWPKINAGKGRITGGLEKRFWVALQAAYPDDVLRLSERQTPHRTYWQINYRGDLFFFYFNNSEARVEYYVPNCNLVQNDARYRRLKKQKNEIEQQTGTLIWDELHGKKAHKVGKVLPNVSLKDERCWTVVREWMCAEMHKLVLAMVQFSGQNEAGRMAE